MRSCSVAVGSAALTLHHAAKNPHSSVARSATTAIRRRIRIPLRFADGSAVSAHAVILATGVSYRQLDAPGVAELTGSGVYYGSALTEATAVAVKP